MKLDFADDVDHAGASGDVDDDVDTVESDCSTFAVESGIEMLWCCCFCWTDAVVNDFDDLDRFDRNFYVDSNLVLDEKMFHDD